MAQYAADVQRLSNWLVYEEEAGSGVTREVLLKSATNATKTGSVLDSTGQLVVAATLADATYILIDDLTRPSAAEYKNVLVLARGHAKVGKAALIFGADVTTDVQRKTATDKLALKNIFAVDQLTYNNV
ncbi:head decoration protein [Pseudomonas phage UNO-G1W1]|uniref:Head decoration protein n=1 Tax=Pseudomonas phage UNO-G1W1 TaxID=3136609 RepID=A0AAX4MWB2_9CAUD